MLIPDFNRQITKGDQMGYLPLGDENRAQEFGYDILTFLILFNSFIPIR